MMATATLSLTLSHLPLIHRYPSTPLLEFPPPLPNQRRPLRERCGFDLKIKTSFAPPENPTQRVHNNGHVQPHRNNLPRRKKTNLRIVVDESVLPAEPSAAVATELRPAADRNLQELIPGLFVAFKPTGDRSDTQELLAERYTHLIDICYPADNSDDFAAGSIEQASEGGLHRLCLTLPASARVNESERAGLALTDAQLRAARDFLAQTFPYSLTADVQVGATRVLIASPARRPTDAMCIAGCYLAFASGKNVGTVLRYIDDEESVLSIWKGEVSEDEVDKTEKVARLWSWLSSIRR